MVFWHFGHWKDTAIMLKGPAVESFTLMFLQSWALCEPKGKTEDWGRFMGYAKASEGKSPGWVLPYGDSPLDHERVGHQFYLDMLYRAKRYVHIMTPYLILDAEMENALKYATSRGVEVLIILPGIPDKRVPYALAASHYRSLIEAGVKIYEYSPGFVHAKAFVSDDERAVVGTINLDYRSLMHHFECAAYMYGTECIADIEADVQNTLKSCQLVQLEKVSRFRRLLGYIMKILAPLM